jgi:uroporphyrin-III C-methyltransferase/precorrin-2 dehydrogenase/sirohydrochlorin ferrochelatase
MADAIATGRDLPIGPEAASRAEAGVKGSVLLVGAGPGDPELLTLKAFRAIRRAEVLLYDHLVAEEILALAPREAQRIYVGKESGCHCVPQEEINRLLVRYSLAGKCVVRLKGGDPFIFGRGGEEVETLTAHSIPFEVIPGVTSASGVSCCAGIPLTHRDHAQAVVFVTGHLRDGSLGPDWEALARPRQTVVIYMGLGALTEICLQLISHGLPASTPAAVVERGTTPKQRVVTGDLASLPRRVKDARLRPPALTIIGEVVKLRDALGWADQAADAAQRIPA